MKPYLLFVSVVSVVLQFAPKLLSLPWYVYRPITGIYDTKYSQKLFCVIVFVLIGK